MLKRVIPVLLLSGKGLIKTERFSNSKYIGDAINAVKIFSEKEVDEIVFMDIEATKQKKEPDYELIKAISSEAYMPFAYGGGVKTLKQAEKILRNGAEKIIINNAFWTNPTEVKNMIREFGSQSVAICINVKKNLLGNYKVFQYTENSLKGDFIEHLRACNEAGFGEVIVQNVDLDGKMTGYDEKIIQIARNNTNLPLVMLGGAGRIEDLNKALRLGCDAAAAGSLFVFYGKYRAVLINYPHNDQIERFTNADM